MKVWVEPTYGFLGALLLVGITSWVNWDSGYAVTVPWRGSALIPYAACLIAGFHKQWQGSKEKAIGIQFMTSIWMVFFSTGLSFLLYWITKLLAIPNESLQASVVMTVGLWEEMLKGLLFAVITQAIVPKSFWERARNKLQFK